MPHAVLVVPAAVVRVVQRRIDREAPAEQSGQPHPARELVEHPLGDAVAEHDDGGATERVVVRRPAHADGSSPVPRVAQQRFGPAKALTLMLAHDQAGEQLGQCVIDAEIKNGTGPII
jgi:hypothetical protein